jgi:S1-C subfamily serine protease
VELGDIIMAANGKRTKKNEDLIDILEGLRVDDDVKLTVRRGGESITVVAKLLKDLGARD